ncbi:hypothetical protein, partial [Vibrio vulnificus]|uniref:hypothetical protein n=1 Tax=Vibrio vulnificus TaxID=672 RepID=UPI004059287C
MVVLLVSLARRAYHFQQLASSSTPFHECRTYYLKSGITNAQFGEFPSSSVLLSATTSRIESSVAYPVTKSSP